MSQQAWRTLCLASFAILVVMSAIGSLLEPHVTGPVHSPLAWLILGVFGAAFLGFIVSVPPLVIRWFIDRQLRIGNAAHPLVVFLAQNEQLIVRAVWVLWAFGTAIAVPAAIQDWMMPR